MAGDGAATGASDEVRAQAIAWLVRLRGEPNDADAANFEQWYAADPRHAEAYDALLDSWEETARIARMPSAQRGRPGGAAWPMRAAAAAAAAVLLLVLTGSVILAHLSRREPAPSSRVASRVGEIRAVALEDGSQVTLDTDSAVEVRFDDGRRGLRLTKGRARFTVAQEAARPFVVGAGASEVVAHGTVFDVELRASQVCVALYQGRVEVRRSAGAAAASTVLAPGQQLVVDGRGVDPVPTAADPRAARWPSGMLSFENAPLADVVASANRYSRTQIVIRDPVLGGRRFTGTLRVGEPAQLAAMLGAMFGVRVGSDRAGNLILGSEK